MTRILCIEDETDIRELIVDELRDAGFSVLEATNGQEGFDTIVSERPDMVICDITMPEMDGRDLYAKLQMEQPDLANIPFIFLTALADKGSMLNGLRCGADAYLTKPVDFDVLMAKIAGCLMRHDVQKAASPEYMVA